jgi:hypothetical protein
MAFKFSVPSPAGDEGVSTETRLKAVQAWVEALPLADTVPATQALHTAVMSLNRTRLGAEDRFRLLELYRGPLLRLLEDLEQDYSKAALPLPEKAREAARLSRELLIEFGYGYKLILLEKTDRFFASKKQLAVHLHRAISTLADTLTLSYKTYTPTPAGVWHEIHQIFHYAQHFGLEETQVESGRRAKVSTIAMVYKQTLLLALADPYRLQPGEVEQILALVQKHHNTVFVFPYSDQLTGAGLFLVRSDTDRPPKSLSGVDSGQITPVDKVLSAANLAYSLGEIAGRLDAGMTLGQLGIPAYVDQATVAPLCRRLQKIWSVPPKRTFNRSASGAHVEVCIGVANIAEVMFGSVRARETVSAGAARAVFGDKLDFQRAGAAPNTLVRQWDILNQSAGGLALKRGARGDSDGVSMAVGEVVAVRFDTGQPWAIGAVRWVYSEDTNGLQFGMQMLAPHADCVSVAPALGNRATRRVPGLRLPELPTMRRPATLIVPHGTYADCDYVIESAEGSQRVRATKLIEQTQSFDAFAFKGLDGPAE